ncbi:MAG: amidohydrolase [Verrucomicrobiota bacterium]
MKNLIFSLAFLLGASPLTRAAEKPADLVIQNAKILTVNSKAPRASAVAIRDGVFTAVGSDASVKPFIGAGTRVIDAKGKTVVPGLIETHVHSTGAARGEASQPFVQLHSIGEIQEWTRRQIAVKPAGAWIRLPRVDVTRIKERRIPTRADLDAAAPNNPAVFTWQYANKQVQILNSAALKAANITKDTEVPPRGKIHLDAKSEPTGVMDNANQLLVKFMPAPGVSDAAYLDSLEKLLRNYNAIGITSIFDRGSNPEGVRTYQKLKSQDRLPVRVTVTLRLPTDGTVAGTEKGIKSLPFKPAEGDDWVRVGPLKISVDGGVLYGTAYMREPYGPSAFSLYGISDAAYRGDLSFNPEKLKNIIRTGHRLGWQMSSHVTGDAGVDAVLDAVEAANADSPIRERRYTLIHAYFPHKETAERAARLGVCVDTQPAWYYKDGDALADALGAHRLENFIGVKTWLDGNVKVALNSDHMQGFDPNTSLNPYNPFLAMYGAVTRKTEGGRVIGVAQRISREEALRLLTLDAAWLSFDEKKKGSIETGKFGDLAMLSDDVLTCPDDKLMSIRSVLTVVAGKVVHEK